MSSTDEGASAAALRKLFREELVAAGQRLRAMGGGIPLGPDAAAETYYVPRPSEQPMVFTEDDVRIDRIRELWKKEGREELCALAASLEAAARAIHTDPDDGEVSSYIYAMF